jgi:membrane fusion protein (multidrug efflux system)
LDRIQTLSERGFATKTNLDQQVAAAATARAQAAQAQATIGDRVISAPFLRLGLAPQHLGRRGRECRHRDRDDQRRQRDQARLSRAGDLAPSLRPGLTIEAKSAAYPDQPFRGQIATIDPVIDPNTRAVTVRARLPQSRTAS